MKIYIATIYIATSDNYGGYQIEAVFTSKENAELYCATNEFYLVEFDADTEVVEKTDREPLILWHVATDFNDEIASIVEQEYTFCGDEEWGRDPITKRIAWMYVPLPAKYDEQQARNIIRDRIAVLNAKTEENE